MSPVPRAGLRAVEAQAFEQVILPCLVALTDKYAPSATEPLRPRVEAQAGVELGSALERRRPVPG